MAFLSHGGISLRYERTGKGLALVFIHGLMGNHTFWDRQVPLRRRFQPVRADLRGHGDSSKPRGTYSIALFGGDVRHLVTALNLDRCLLVGSSMGGLVAQQAVGMLGERVVGLVLVGTTAKAVDVKGHAHGVKPEEAESFADMVERDYKGFVRTLASRCFKEGRTELVPWTTQQMNKTPPYVAASALAAVQAADHRQLLETIAVPTLVCHGRHDRIFAFGAAEHLHKHIKGSRLVAFDDSGHLPMLEESERFNAELTAFAEQLG
jgi:pimeloyl-ACP methyl ester carboxylesterase